MSVAWQKVTFDEAPLAIIDGDRGKNYPKQDEFSDTVHCLFLNTGNVTKSGFEFSHCQFITEQKDGLLRKGKLSREDVIMTTRGTIGNAAYFNGNVPYDNIRINSGMVIFRTDDEKLLPSFLYQYIRSEQFNRQVNALRSGAAQPQLPIRDIKVIELPLPPIDQQESISSLLEKYDDLIENNKRRIELLEESARQLYKEWFVRFRFPGHEHVPIVDGVPEGWSNGCVSDLGDVITGKTPSTKVKENFGGDIPFVKTPDMHASSIIIEPEEYLSERGANTQSNKFLPKFSILVACIGARLGVVSLNARRCQTNQQINGVVPRSENYTFYAYLTLKGFREKLLAIGGGATMPNVNKSKFSGMEVLLPPESLLESFHDMVTQPFFQMEKLIEMNQKLVEARELLLPKLMSGDIAV